MCTKKYLFCFKNHLMRLQLSCKLRHFLLDVFQEVCVGPIKSKLPCMASTCCCDLVSYSLSPGVWQFRHNKIVQSPHENYFKVCRQHKRKVRSREDDNYSNWVIINYGVYKGLYHISCLLQIIKPFIRPPQGLLFLVVKTF